MKIEKILIVGSVTRVQQTGLQCAMRSFHTTLYDTCEEALERCKAGQQTFISSRRNANPDHQPIDPPAQ